jgi:glycosyltransferase involved in cell wall biosynthesis
MDVGNPLLPLVVSLTRLRRGVVIGLHGGLGALLSRPNPSRLAISLAKTYIKVARLLGIKLHSITKTQSKRIRSSLKSSTFYSPLVLDCSCFRVGGIEEYVTPSFRVLYVGRGEPKAKGHELLLKVVEKVTEKNPSIKFTLVGRGLDKLARRTRLYADYLGFIANREAMSEVYKKSSLFLSTSRWETFGLSIAEALLSGLPCVVTRIPIAIEHIRGYAGLVVDRSPDEISRAILRYHEIWKKDRELYARMRKKIAERYQRVFCDQSFLIKILREASW